MAEYSNVIMSLAVKGSVSSDGEGNSVKSVEILCRFVLWSTMYSGRFVNSRVSINDFETSFGTEYTLITESDEIVDSVVCSLVSACGGRLNVCDRLEYKLVEGVSTNPDLIVNNLLSADDSTDSVVNAFAE